MIPADPIEQAAQAGRALEAMLRTEKLLRARIKQLEAEIAANELAMRAASAGLQMAKARIERLEAGIRDAIEALERNSTSAPVLEALRALAGKTEPPP